MNPKTPITRHDPLAPNWPESVLLYYIFDSDGFLRIFGKHGPTLLIYPNNKIFKHMQICFAPNDQQYNSNKCGNIGLVNSLTSIVFAYKDYVFCNLKCLNFFAFNITSLEHSFIDLWFLVGLRVIFFFFGNFCLLI